MRYWPLEAWFTLPDMVNCTTIYYLNAYKKLFDYRSYIFFDAYGFKKTLFQLWFLVHVFISGYFVFFLWVCGHLESISFKVTFIFTFLSILISLLGFMGNKLTGFDGGDCCWFSGLFCIHFNRNAKLGFQLDSFIHLFYVLTWPFIIENIKPKVQKATRDNSPV